jgi:hypothetical protein
MPDLNQWLLILHFLGLALGMSTSFANMVMGGLIAAAPPGEKAILGRFPPVMSKVGGGGLILLWVTGLILVFTKWGGFGSMPWQFHAKLTAVVLLTVVVGYVHALQAKAARGDTAAAARLPSVGSVATALAIVAVIFAVLTFD